MTVESGPDAGRVVELPLGPFSLGSGEATIETDGSGRVVLRPADEVFVNGEPASEELALNGNETIRLGATLVVLSPEDPRPPPAEEESLEELAEAPAVAPVRRLQALRSAGQAVRRARSAARRAAILAAAALVVALTLLVLSLTGAIGGEDGANVEDIVAEAKPSTVSIRASSRGEEQGGSGWVLDARRGLVVTNFHILNAAEKFEIGVDGEPRDAELIGAAPCEDLAVLRTDDREGLTTMPLGSGNGLEEGEQVVAVGFPATASLDDQQLSSTAGVVSAADTSIELPVPDAPRLDDLVQTDAALNPGNSGGPLLDGEGRLVGVNTAIIEQIERQPIQNQGYAIGIDRVREVVTTLRKGESIGWLGVGLGFPAGAERQRLPRGVLALPGPGGNAGDLAGKVISAVDSLRLAGTFPDYCNAVGDSETGEDVSLTVVSRGGARREVRVEYE